MLENLHLPKALIQDINSNSKKIVVPSGTQIISIGDRLDYIPFVLNGTIRVFIENEDTGKEVLLYYVENGGTCLMSMIASFGDKISKVSATTEINTEVATVSNEKIREWQIQYPEWNNLILDLFVNRYNDMINTIEELSFKKIEDRLKIYLKKYLNKSGKIVVSKTHLQISKDLGTSREVISRALKKIESEMDYEFFLKK